MEDRGKGGRPKEWEPNSPKGQLLLNLLAMFSDAESGGDKYQQITDMLNRELGTNYTREGVKSACYRYNYQVTKFDQVKTRSQEVRERFGLEEADDIPVLRLHDDRNWVPFWMTSDWHVGHAQFMEDLFMRHRQMSIDLKAYLMHGGDALETAVPTHMPQTVWSQTMNPSTQAEWMQRALYELLYGQAQPGNHEGRIINLTSLCPVKQVADEVGMLYRRYGGSLIVQFDSGVEYEIHQKHGSGGGGKNSEKQVKDWGDIYRDADVVAIGHDHHLWAKYINQHFKTIHTPDGKRKRVKFNQLGMRTGHFLEYGGYVEGVPYLPAEPGSVMLWLNTQRREMKWEVLGQYGEFIDMSGMAA